MNDCRRPYRLAFSKHYTKNQSPNESSHRLDQHCCWWKYTIKYQWIKYAGICTAAKVLHYVRRCSAYKFRQHIKPKATIYQFLDKSHDQIFTQLLQKKTFGSIHQPPWTKSIAHSTKIVLTISTNKNDFQWKWTCLGRMFSLCFSFKTRNRNSIAQIILLI